MPERVLRSAGRRTVTSAIFRRETHQAGRGGRWWAGVAGPSPGLLLQSIEAGEGLPALLGVLIVPAHDQWQSPGGVPQQRLGLVDPADLQLQDTELEGDHGREQVVLTKGPAEAFPKPLSQGGCAIPIAAA